MKTILLVSLVCLCGCSHAFRAGVESELKSVDQVVQDVEKDVKAS